VTALDAGCGFGFAVLLLRWLGAADVHGVDISAGMLRTVRAYLPLLPVRGRLVRPRAVRGGVSHYRDVDAFIGEAARGPPPGGVLLIHDHNNGRNPKTRRESRALWEEFETGLPSEPGTRRERDSSYRLRRAEIIRGRSPSSAMGR
jgi:SAM-dependent methyltransferase